MSDNPLDTYVKNTPKGDRRASTGSDDATDPFIDALIQQESGGDPNAVSSAGAVGLAQSMPATAKDPGYGVKPLENPRDPEQARRFAKEYMGAMFDEFDDPGHALMAYNWGPGNTKSWLKSERDTSNVPEETRDYVRSLGPAAEKATGQKVSTPFYTSSGEETSSPESSPQSPEERIRKSMLQEKLGENAAPPDGTLTTSGQPY